MSDLVSSGDQEHGSTPNQPPDARVGVAGELPWLITLGVAVCGLTVYLLNIGRQGGEIADVLALPVAIASLAATVVFYRLGHRKNDLSRKAKRDIFKIDGRPTWLVAALTTTCVAAIISATTVLVPRMIGAQSDEVAPKAGSDEVAPAIGAIAEEEDDRAALAQYLSGQVTIGINGTLPGWSKSSSPEQASGFDAALVEFLKNKYHFTPKYKNLRPGEREDALATGLVKLVVANYSMNHPRDEKIDFAGPYFHDRSGILCSSYKIRCDQTIPQEFICVTEGTIAAENLRYAQHRKSIAECMDAFYDASNKSVGAISTDLAILQAYGHSVGSVSTVTWANKRDHPISEEDYGIGLPNNSPELCRALSNEIDDFLNDPGPFGWASAFNSNLSGTDPYGRKPSGSDRSWCK